MKTQKLICKTLITFFVAMSFLMLISAIIAFFISPEHTNLLLIGFCISSVVYAFLDVWLDYIKDEENPLSIAKQKDALNYIYCHKSGSKQEFISKYSDKLYQHFLLQGYIMQFRFKSLDTWEISLKGQKKKEKLQN